MKTGWLLQCKILGLVSGYDMDDVSSILITQHIHIKHHHEHEEPYLESEFCLVFSWKGRTERERKTRTVMKTRCKTRLALFCDMGKLTGIEKLQPPHSDKPPVESHLSRSKHSETCSSYL